MTSSTLCPSPTPGGSDVVIVVAIHDVPDYGRWKQAFDRGMGVEAHTGMLRHRLFRAADDGDEICVEFDFDTVEHAEAFLGRADEEWLDDAGLTMYPPVFVGTRIEVVEHPVAEG